LCDRCVSFYPIPGHDWLGEGALAPPSCAVFLGVFGI
jgi:hypothetical protein